eukprot:COSAG05_NODE_2692_length_2766_cov_1.839895_2_plen_60_part_00
MTRTIERKNAAVAGLKTEIEALKAELERQRAALGEAQSLSLQRQVTEAINVRWRALHGK